MSSSSVCQGLQSCLEPRVIEPRVLRLKLAPPGSNLSPPSGTEKQPLITHECDTKDNVEGRGWSFLEALADTSHCNKTEKNNDQVYVHPTVKRSSSMLSEKSLEMCTESLGSETGSNAGESSDDVSLFSFDTTHDDAATALGVGGNNNTNTNWVSRRVNKACSFPPPLTSITDFGGVRVRPHREGGRLILEAVASPPPRPYFHAERGDGRLRLRPFEEGVFACDGDEEQVAAAEEEGEEGEEEEQEGETQKKKQEGCGEEEEEENGAEEELEECVENENVEDEMGVTKFARPSRCKESGNRDIFCDGYFELPPLSLCL